MRVTRRDFVAGVGATALAVGLPGWCTANGEKRMYGLIGKMKAVPGQRDVLIAILLEGTSGDAAMPGCLSYVIAQDPSDADAVWITEVWDNPESHMASLSLPAVQEAIRRAKPLIAGFGERFETVPVGGHGLGAGASGAA